MDTRKKFSFTAFLWALTFGLFIVGSVATAQISASSDLSASSTQLEQQQKRWIYFHPGSDWSKANIWYWFNDGTPNQLGEWPGTGTMEPVDGHPGWFYKTLTGKDVDGFLFNDGVSGGKQSLDITNKGNGCYILESSSWFPANTEKCPFNPTGEIVPVEVYTDKNSGEFSTESLTVTLFLKGSAVVNNEGRYTVDGTDPRTSQTAISFKSGDAIVVGKDLASGDQVILSLYAVDEKNNKSKKVYTYKKVKSDYVKRDNVTLLQGFYWYIRDPMGDDLHYTKQPEKESNLWQYIAEEKAEEIYQDGFSHVWLPPTGKAFISGDEDKAGKFNVGYAIYDHYDLGEFYQSSHVRTKYGTKAQLHDAVGALKQRKIKVIADIVMNHMLGTDNVENVQFDYAFKTRNFELQEQFPYSYKRHPEYNVASERLYSGTVPAYLNFDFENTSDVENGGSIGPRGDTYSDFTWKKEHFDGMENYGTYYLFEGKQLDNVNIFPDMPAGSPSDYRALRSDVILGGDLDLQHPEVQEEMINWTKWLVKEVGFDGFRVDAVRHMDTGFVRRWAHEIKDFMNDDEMLMFGENWDGWTQRLDAYLKGNGSNKHFSSSNPGNYAGIGNSMSLFDVPLHYDFQKIAGENTETKDISTLPESGLLAKSPDYAITFVDNHDTVPTEMLASYIPLHTKYQAYVYILLNTKGIPCVYYRDFYKGNALPASAKDPYTNTHTNEMNFNLKRLVKLRNEFVYGHMQYFKGHKILGAKIQGRNNNGGIVYLIKNNNGPSQSLQIPTDGKEWVLVAGHGRKDRFELTGNWAVWIQKDQAEKLGW